VYRYRQFGMEELGFDNFAALVKLFDDFLIVGFKIFAGKFIHPPFYLFTCHSSDRLLLK
jgi:hypothetical protein